MLLGRDDMFWKVRQLRVGEDNMNKSVQFLSKPSCSELNF